MPQGDKSKYTDKQERKAEHIEQSYEKPRRSGEGGRAPRLGHGQQGRRRGKTARRIGPGQDDGPSRGAQGRSDRRRGIGGAFGRSRSAAAKKAPLRVSETPLTHLTRGEAGNPIDGN